MFGLPSFAAPLIAGLMIAIAAGGTGFRFAHDLDQGVIQKMRAADAIAAASAQAQARKIEDQQAQLSQANDAAEAATQTALEARARVVIKEVPTYVTAAQDARGCVTWGMLRVHDAAALGVDPSTLKPPAGKSNDECSPVEPSAYAAAVASNYAIALQNAEQLDALEADITERVDTFNAK